MASSRRDIPEPQGFGMRPESAARGPGRVGNVGATNTYVSAVYDGFHPLGHWVPSASMPPGKPRERSRGCTVPRILGLSFNTARDRCLADGLLIYVEGPVPPPPVAVVAQSPPSGSSAGSWTEVVVQLATKKPRWYPRPLGWFTSRIGDAVVRFIDAIIGSI
jgi:hypothetical protein